MANTATAFETFDASAGARWAYVQDGVMGGVSEGRATLDDGVMRMTGTVSTDNNGGFIQVRQRGFAAWDTGAKGLKLNVKGNGEVYYIFLRTPNLNRFSWSYRATFEAGAEWAQVEIPFADFKPSSENMPQDFGPEEVSTIGIVAYGRDHEADLSVASIELF